MSKLFDHLIQNLGEAKAISCTIGLNWTVVETELGCGLAHTPSKNTLGCKPVEIAGQLAGSPIRTLAGLAFSENLIERAIGTASINAFYNRYDLDSEETNGLNELDSYGSNIALVGRFPGLDKRGFNPMVIELNPKEGEHPTDRAEAVIDQCDQVIITASTLINGTIENLLGIAKDKKVFLVGPSTPLTPLLFEFGINVLSGMLVSDPNMALKIAAEGGSVKNLKSAGRYATLRKSRENLKATPQPRLDLQENSH